MHTPILVKLDRGNNAAIFDLEQYVQFLARSNILNNGGIGTITMEGTFQILKFRLYDGLRNNEEGRKGSIGAFVLMNSEPKLKTKAVSVSVRQLNRLMDDVGIRITDMDHIDPRAVREFKRLVGTLKSKAVVEYEAKKIGDQYEIIREDGTVEIRKIGYDYTDPKKPILKENAKDFVSCKVTDIVLSERLQDKIDDRALDNIDQQWNEIDQLFAASSVSSLFAKSNSDPDPDVDQDEDNRQLTPEEEHAESDVPGITRRRSRRN